MMFSVNQILEQACLTSYSVGNFRVWYAYGQHEIQYTKWRM